MTEKIKLEVLYGSFPLGGGWIPNPYVSLSGDEQYRINDETIQNGERHRHMVSMEQVIKRKPI